VLTIAAGSGSGASQVRDIGLGLALGILMDTFLVRTLLVPSTVVLLGKWNWWPSKLEVDEPGEIGVTAQGRTQPGAAAPATAHGDAR
jgi:RND superfamily putative drug exporter